MICFCGNKMIDLKINNINYNLCPSCKFLSKNTNLTEKEEKDRYDLHICDEKYIEYMNLVYEKISKYLNDGKSIDYVCGKIHILADILNKNNKNCDYYDYYYYDKALNSSYDNIILIEVFEHIKNIYNFMIKLKSLLNDNGRIIIMTKRYPFDLNNWWYLRDITHVSFVKNETMIKLAELLKLKLIIDNELDLYVFEK